MRCFAVDTMRQQVSRIVAISGVAFLATLQSASAGELPASAVKLSSAEIKALYSGKTADWSRSQAYFAPNGTTKNVSKQGKWVGNGTWTVRGNRICMKTKGTSFSSGKAWSVRDCWSWFRDGKKTWTLWSVRFNGEKPSKKDYYTGEAKKLKTGDRTKRRYNRLVKKLDS